jgi:cytochrome oxidase assembly protein ShyY1
MSISPGKAKSAQLKFTINWKVVIFTLLFFPLLIRLGFWQLQRAEEKRTIQQLVEQQQELPPQPVEIILTDVEDDSQVLYRHALNLGLFDQKHYWLIENRTLNGKNGFEVVTPFNLMSGHTILVNRGWVAGTGYRDQLPLINTPTEELIIKGQLVKPSVNQLLIGEVKPLGDWPRVILQMDVDVMEKELGRPLLPWILQVDAESAYAFQTNWTVMNASVSKHLGYAYQWFAMALTLLVLTIVANTNIAALLLTSQSKSE